MKLHVIASILIDPEIKVRAGRIVLFDLGKPLFYQIKHQNQKESLRSCNLPDSERNYLN